MVGINTAKKWNLKEFSFICGDPNDRNEVTKIFCIVCREFYRENLHESDKLQGHIKGKVKNWIYGSTTVKKNNAVDHLKSKIHSRAVLRRKEKQATSAGKEIAQETGLEKAIVEYAREMSKSQKSELVKKF